MSFNFQRVSTKPEKQIVQREGHTQSVRKAKVEKEPQMFLEKKNREAIFF